MTAIASNHNLSELLGRATHLYSLPAVAVEVLALTSDPAVGASKLKQCIERDPALVARLLKVVNSALFGLGRPVSDLGQAITLLGVKPLKMLVLGFSLPRSLSEGVQTQVLASYWKHALTKAVAARHLGERLGRINGDEAFLAGLLSDLGMLVLIQTLGEPYTQVVRRVRHMQRDLLDVERRALGFDHLEMTVQLLRSWHMPPVLVDAIAQSAPAIEPSPEGVDPNEKLTLGRVLAWAELLTLVLVERQDERLPNLLHDLKARLDLNEIQLAEWSAAIESRVVELADVLSLTLPDNLDYVAVITQAHQRLSDNVTELTTHWMQTAGNASGLASDATLADQIKALMSVAGNPMAVSRSLAAKPQAPQEAEPNGNPPIRSAAARHGEPAGAATVPAEAPLAQPAGADNPTVQRWLAERLQRLAEDCRQARCPISLVLIAIDRDERLRREHGMPQFVACCQQLTSLARQIDHLGMSVWELKPGHLALALPNCDRAQAAAVGSAVLRGMRQYAAGRHELELSSSVGVACVQIVPKNFATDNLVLASLRCLQAAQVSGNTLKSIEL